MSWFDQRPDDAMMGSFEAVGAEHIQTVEAAQFREAMSQLGAAVHVVTTAGPAGTAGFTPTAGGSGSHQPATLLVCVHPRRPGTPLPHSHPGLCVNTLRGGTDAIADVFAGRTGVTMAERFDTGSWGALASGAPILNDAVVACDCRVIEIKSVATHNVVFAGVVAVRLGRPGPALVYHERAYKQV